MKKIFINCPHGGKDPGAVYGSLTEKHLTYEICLRIVNNLIHNYDNIHVKMFREDDSFYSLDRICKESNRFGSDIFVSPHVNAGKGTGFESYIFNSNNISSKTVNNQVTIHKSIMDKISKYNVIDRGSKRANFFVLRNTNAPALLTENMFIDRAEDRKLLQQSTFLKDVADGHVDGIVKVLNLRKKPSTNDGKLFYRVITGSFNERENAEERINELKKLGYESFIDIYKR